MTARYLIGPVLDRIHDLDAGSVDLICTSPPFMNLRAYLPADHPHKAQELGTETTPGEYIDHLVEIIEACDRVLAAHGSLVLELGDSMSGSGGSGGDYDEGGMREGQARWMGTARSAGEHAAKKPWRSKDPFDGRDNAAFGTGAAARPARTGRPYNHKRDRAQDTERGILPASIGDHWRGQRDGWPQDKSLTLIPEIFRITLAYGFNPLTGRPTPPWRIRTVRPWLRTSPPVGALYDNFRFAHSDMLVACHHRRRWFDLDAVRRPSDYDRPNLRGNGSRRDDALIPGQRRNHADHTVNAAGAPPLDWFIHNPAGYPGAHYATWDPGMLIETIQAMCPTRVCVDCGQPSWRITRRVSANLNTRRSRGSADDRRQTGAVVSTDVPEEVRYETVDWTCCGCGPGCQPTVETGEVDDGYRWAIGPWGTKNKGIVRAGLCDETHWRRGVVLDPFAGTGSTAVAATGLGREAILIDIDARNLDLARDRLGMFLETDNGRAVEDVAGGAAL